MSDPSFPWATVTDDSPLRIRIDGDTAELGGITPDSLVAGLTIGDRVRVLLDGGAPTILGRLEV